MKPIHKDELYQNLGEFLKSKGIELKEGSYTKGIHAGCSLLADAINLSQTGFERAKAGLDRTVNQVRQVIHEKTAPKPPRAAAASRNVTPKDGRGAAGRAARARSQKKSKAQDPKPKVR